jgi:hypothetical protein
VVQSGDLPGVPASPADAGDEDDVGYVVGLHGIGRCVRQAVVIGLHARNRQVGRREQEQRPGSLRGALHERFIFEQALLNRDAIPHVRAQFVRVADE